MKRTLVCGILVLPLLLLLSGCVPAARPASRPAPTPAAKPLPTPPTPSGPPVVLSLPAPEAFAPPEVSLPPLPSPPGKALPPSYPLLGNEAGPVLWERSREYKGYPIEVLGQVMTRPFLAESFRYARPEGAQGVFRVVGPPQAPWLDILVYSKTSPLVPEDGLFVLVKGTVASPVEVETVFGTRGLRPSVEWRSLYVAFLDQIWPEVLAKPSPFVDKYRDHPVVLSARVVEAREEAGYLLLGLNTRGSAAGPDTFASIPNTDANLKEGDRLLLWGVLRAVYQERPLVLIKGFRLAQEGFLEAPDLKGLLEMIQDVLKSGGKP